MPMHNNKQGYEFANASIHSFEAAIFKVNIQ